MSTYDLRQDKPYRRGLILGLTMAEIMMLLIFVLLMALSSAISLRDARITALDSGVSTRLVEAIQHEYPNASPDDYYKELILALEARRAVEKVAGSSTKLEQLLKDALLGKQVSNIAEKSDGTSIEALLNQLKTNVQGGKKGGWPPFFNLSEAGGYYFDSGKATLRPEFELKLKTDVIPLLVAQIKGYDIDVVEVIGHTDEVPMVGESNLDSSLIAVAANKLPTSDLRSTDNAGLAMARAVAVVQILRADDRLRSIRILPLSGAQMIVPIDGVADGTSGQSDQLRRRIEIRTRKSTKAIESKEVSDESD